MQYAFDEFGSLLSPLSAPISNKDPIVHYACALISELTYHHVPQFEIDNKKRAKLIPCQGYRSIITRGASTSVLTYLEGLDLGRSFVAVDRGIIAVGIKFNKLLFIGFRGTKFLFDWRINLKAKLAPVGARWRTRGPWPFIIPNGQLHSGFAEESIRICSKIMDEVRARSIDEIDHVFLTGHSLGGAVAAISENILTIAPSSTCIIGSPRYCDVSAYLGLPNGPPTQIRRPGDVVPFVPPRRLGYADHPYEFGTTGAPIFDLRKDRSLPLLLWKWGSFFSKLAGPHFMEVYRNELGNTANAAGANKDFAPYEKLTIADIGKS